ncbi:MAG: fatty acid CoA ligase family protein [Planctomycetaceae bacterium]|jgi:acyl-CoA synthetase (AMP-forming)/AMP-acid ligase II|nr:fatty acid CoA ligase family protein [Planctomycetaceae bacterium]
MGDPPRELGGNVAQRLAESAKLAPDGPAIIVCDAHGRSRSEISFRRLDELVNRLAAGLIANGLAPGDRIVLMVRPGQEFLALVFALFRAGAVVVLIDPGMGLKHVIDCLEGICPRGFVSVPSVQWARWYWQRKFPVARLNVHVGGWAPSSLSYRRLALSDPGQLQPPTITGTDPAAIIFTSGSTGPAKGVEYEHGMFCAQADLLREHFDIKPGEKDLPAFPLFAMFNTAMGVTSVFPSFDPTRPAAVDPRHVIAPIQVQQVSQAFGSPALWDRVGRYCQSEGITLPSLVRVLSAGAPVPPRVVRSIRNVLQAPNADVYTPYGATEALPVSVISGEEIDTETAERSARGSGTCVGRLFPGIDVRIIPIDDSPISSFEDLELLRAGEIGEILVRGPSVTRRYFRHDQATTLAKVPDGSSVWHRMGDLGYLDDQNRLWFCGRKAHRVETDEGLLFSVPCESIYNEHSSVFRSALVGLGPRPRQTPVIVVELTPGVGDPTDRLAAELLALGAAHTLTARIHNILFHPSLPVDIRHNVKIDRERLAFWATGQCSPDAQEQPGMHHT